jgi:hypothetical protein
MMMSWRLGVLAVMGWVAVASAVAMEVRLLPPWDGKVVPADQICQLRGGAGTTPPMQVTGLPHGTVRLQVEYNDVSYYSMAFDGGHGVLSFDVAAPEAELASVAAMTSDLPDGVRVVSPSRATGRFASDGYLPPCSGGRGHMYSSTVKAVGGDNTVLDTVVVELGLY